MWPVTLSCHLFNRSIHKVSFLQACKLQSVSLFISFQYLFHVDKSVILYKLILSQKTHIYIHTRECIQQHFACSYLLMAKRAVAQEQAPKHTWLKVRTSVSLRNVSCSNNIACLSTAETLTALTYGRYKLML